ncbi:MAG TPA: hypothetical protein VK541_23095 [Pedobacter sp.]|uniref:hypothetical protein n=1 Tax=Pedobacter sp. TaxID=1411316 RepID=UPI002C39E407|nr:hypothetical protein [Pedobacter sp.]HMI05395.1 hypothetical protein [Pedobacter sp.]
MDPFNIIIKSGGEKIDLNIHPQEAGAFKVVYHGALIGEVFMGSRGGNWEAVTADQLEPGGFPVYEYDESSGHQDILLDDAVIQAIGKEISVYENPS